MYAFYHQELLGNEQLMPAYVQSGRASLAGSVRLCAPVYASQTHRKPPGLGHRTCVVAP